MHQPIFGMLSGTLGKGSHQGIEEEVVVLLY
jgi:hypothetical protein